MNRLQRVSPVNKKLILQFLSRMQSKKFIGLEEDDDAVNALKLMTVNNIGRILVKKDETISGIVSRTDIHSVMIRLDYINNHK